MTATQKASVGPQVSILADRVQTHLGSRIADYRRQYAVVYETDERVVFRAETGH